MKTFRIALVALLLAAFSLPLLRGDMPAVQSGQWAATGAMSDARGGASAALLPSGLVLVTGGTGTSGVLATAELFGPDGQFTAAGTMLSARADHASVVLGDGRVLVVGGRTSEGAVASAETFGADGWAAAGQLTDARWGHTATLLADGRVLIVGGENESGQVGSVETFDPATGEFAVAGTLTSPRKGHAAARLADGRVLIAGGFGGGAALNSINIFDPSTGSISVGPSLALARAGLSATTLLDGKVLFFGGNDGTNDLASAEVFDPVAGTVTGTASAATARRDHQAFLLPNNNSVLIVGGASAGAAVASAELYVPWVGQFRPTGSMAAARAHATGSALSRDGLLLVAGGDGLASSETYGFATIKTDKDDYAPGTTVTMTGSGWQPGETVTLSMVESPLLDTHPLVPVVADANGNINSTEFVPDEHDINIRFYLTARGAGSQAQTTFTDAKPNKITAVGAQSPSPVSAGNSATYQVTVSFNGTVSDLCNATLSTTGLPAGAGFSFAPSPSTNAANTITSTNPNTDVTTTLTVSTTAGTTPPGTTTFRITATGTGTACNGLTASTIPGGGGGVAADPTLAVSQAVSTTTFGPAPTPTYLGGNFTVSASNNSGGAITYSRVSGPCALVSGATFSSSGAGSCVVQAASASTTNYLASSATQTVTIAKATPTITWANPANIVYGTALSGTQLNATASTAGSFVYTPLSGTILNAGASQTLHVAFTPADTTSFNNASKDVTINVDKANATIVVTPYSVTYDGLAHTASGTATGVGAANLSAQLTLGGTTHTNAGDYLADGWSFAGGTNYNDASGTVHDVIAKANATIVVTPYSVTYDSLAHTATGTATGVGAADLSAQLTLSATTHTNAGDYSSDGWSFSGGTNYSDASGTVHDVIAKANATIVVTAYSVTYDSLAHTATGTATGVGAADLSAQLTLSGTTHTNAGDYATDGWSFAGGTNYNNASGTVHDVIAKATATIVVTPYSVTYDSLAHTASGTATGVGSDGLLSGLVLSGTTHTNAGDYATDGWSFAGGTNYNNASGTVHDVIAKATATIVVTPYSVTYDSLAHTASGTATGVGSDGLLSGLVLSGTTHTNAGDYATDGWTFAGGTNYNDASGTVHDVIAKANATIVVTPYSVTYDGAPHSASGTATGVGSADLSALLTLSGTTHTSAGDYATDGWSFAGGTNYNDASGTVHDAIAKANATIVVTPYSVTYDSLAHTASGTATGVASDGLLSGLVLSGTTHTSAGDYATDGWSFAGGTNYNDASGTVHDAIAKANATIVVTPYSVTYDSSPHSATGTATGVGSDGLLSGQLTLTGTTHTNAGDYPSDGWSFSGGTNYNDASGTVHDVIAKATATIVVTPYSVTYDSSPHSATGTATGVGSDGLLSGLVLSGTTHTNAGDFATDGWSFAGGTNYNDASGTVHDAIAKATATIVVTPYSVTYDSLAHTATGTATGVGSDGLLSGLVLNGTTHTNAGDYLTDGWSFAGGTNYNDASGTVHDAIAKATATIVVTPYSVTYDSFAHTATGTATGVGSDGLLSGLALNGTTHTNAGDYLTDGWSFAGGTNYNDASGTVHDAIAKANPTVNVTGYTGVYDALAHGAVGTATGVGSVSLAGVDLGASFTNVPGGTASWTFSDVTGNYNNTSGTAAIVISKATANVVVSGYTGVYDGAAHGATGTATGVGSVSLAGLDLGASFTNVPGGTATWTFTDVTGNYNNATGTAAIVISKATANVVVHGYTGVYDGAAHGATGSATGVGSVGLAGLDLGATFTNVPGGTATWTFTDVTGNYNDATGTAAIVISKATANVVVHGYTGVYGGAAHGATGSATGVGSVSLTGLDFGASFTNVPGGTATWTFTDVTGNYNDATGTAAIVLTKAAASVTVTGFSGVYDGAAHGVVSSSATGVSSTALSGLVIDPTTYANVPGGLVHWTFSNANYEDQSGDAAVTITKAAASVTVTGFSGMYDGAAHGVVSSSATGVSSTALSGLVIDPTTYANVPGGLVHWTFSNANYEDQSGDATVSITKAAASVTVTGFSGMYDGAAHGVVSSSATGVSSTALSGLVIDPTTYANVPGGLVHWTFSNANYEDQSGDAAVTITKATPSVTVTGFSGVYDGAAHGATGSATGVGSVGLAGLDLGATFTNVPGGTATWTFTDVTGNYNNATGTAAIVLTKAAASVTVTGFSGVYDGAAHGVISSSATGVSSTALSGLVIDPTTYANVPGGLVHWTFSNANYDDQSGNAAVTITKAAQTITFGALGAKTFGDPDFGVSATASSALAVSFAASGTCTLSGSSVHLPGAGNCTITASQGGNGNYNAATPVARSFTIGQATQTITFAAPANRTLGDSAFTVTASGGASGNPVTFSLGAGSVGCTVTSGLVTITGVTNTGQSCIIKASQLGNANYSAAADVSQGFQITYRWDGYLQPINDTAHQIGVSQSKFKLGQTIPVKFEIKNAAGNVVTQVGNPTFSRTNSRGACDATAAPDSITEIVNPDGDGLFKLTGSQYLYGWSTKGLAVGQYRIYANLADGTQRWVDVCLQK